MDEFDLRKWTGLNAAGGDVSEPQIIDQITIDSRRIDSSHALFVALPGLQVDGSAFVMQAAQAGARYALVRSDWQAPANLPSGCTVLRAASPLKAFQEIASAYRLSLPTAFIAIGGCYGKTMVKDLLADMVALEKPVAASPESFNSQIGVPLSIFKVHNSHKIAIIEAAFSQKGEMDHLARMINPDCSVITHIGKKHVTTLGDVSITAEETCKLLHTNCQWALVPHDPLLTPHLQKSEFVTHFWNTPHHALPQARVLPTHHFSEMTYELVFPDGEIYKGKATSGFYYFLDLINITAKAAWLLGISSASIARALSQYTPEPMRTEIWKSSLLGTTFINDSYCSDPQSVERSLRYFKQGPHQGKKTFVFGGLKGVSQSSIDFRRIGKSIVKSQVDRLLLLGDQAFLPLMEEVQKDSPQTEIICCATFEETLKTLQATVKAEDVVLIKGAKKYPLDDLTEKFEQSAFTNQCVINLASIETNLAAIRHKLGKNTEIMVMVKALAYGTDDVQIAKFLETCGIKNLGVSYVDEGIALKRAGVRQKIFAINAAVYEAEKAVKWDLEVGVGSHEIITALNDAAKLRNKIISVHLHVDTGMSRFGCRPEEALDLAQTISSLPHLKLAGIMTHFASADIPEEDAFTLAQADSLDKAITQIEAAGIPLTWKHAANSSAAVRFSFPQYNMARIGLSIYGLYSSEATRNALELRLALSLYSRIVGINVCKAGETISYGRKYRVQQAEQRVAVLPIGYFDGLHRNYSGKGHVIIRGQPAPMVGTICMDFMMVDITHIPNASVGDPVLVFGEDEYGYYLSPEDLARQGDSIIHELITCLGPRIQRVFVYEEALKKR